jgi:hypothetical protein
MSGRGHLLGLYLLVLVVDMVLLLLSLVLYEVLNLLLESFVHSNLLRFR